MTARVFGESLDDAYVFLVDHLFGCEVVPSRNGDTKELVGGSIVIADAARNWAFARKPSPCYAAGELLWYLGWSDDGNQISAYAPQYVKFLEHAADGRLIAQGAYGKRWGPQMQRLLAELRGKPGTRQAILTTYQPADLGRDTPDCPCTLSLQFLERDGKLHLITTMRSNDIWLGSPYDIFCFTSIQRLIADELELDLGQYIHNVGSIHLYTRDEGKARAMRGAEPCNVSIPFKRLEPGTFMKACADAAAIERRIRSEYGGIEFVEEAVSSAGLDKTLLGACCLLAWMSRWGFAETGGVPNVLLHEAHEWLANHKGRR